MKLEFSIRSAGLLLLFSAAAGILCAAEGGLAMPLGMQGGTARAAAMGLADAGLAQGASALLWNPAGLGALNSMEIGLHHNTGLGGLVQETAVFGFDAGGAGGFGASMDYMNNGMFERRDNYGNLLPGENGAAGFGGSLGWGKQVLTGFFAGITMKASRKTLVNSVYYSMAGDAGILWEATPFLKFGAVYLNMGGTMGGFPVASGFRAGASYDIDLGEKNGIILAFSGEAQAGGISTLNAGFEWTGFSFLSARAGYVYSFSSAQLDGLTGLTAGLGIKLQGMSLDYAYTPFGELGNTHRVSLTYEISRQPEKPEAKKTILPRSDKRVIAFELVHFEFDKSDITPEAKAILEKNITVLRDNPDTEVRIAGFTSQSGGEEYNQKLSERRAYAIRNFLIRDGNIPEGRLTIIGYGDTNPLVMEDKPGEINSTGAKLNRRGFFEIVRQK